MGPDDGTDGTLASTATNGGTTAFSTATDTASIVVTGVNDAPVLNVAAAPALTAVNEDAGAPVGRRGHPRVRRLVDFNPPAGGLDNVTDVDAGALTGIAVTAADSTTAAGPSRSTGAPPGHRWVRSPRPAHASSPRTPTTGSTSSPTPNFNGNLATAITFRAWDQTTGTDGTLVSTATNGGTTAFSTATDTASLVVTAVNDAPVLDASKGPVLAALNEDAPAPVGAVGTLVSALVDFATPAGQVDNITDIDAGALLGIAVTAADADQRHLVLLPQRRHHMAGARCGYERQRAPPRGGHRQPALLPARRELQRQHRHGHHVPGLGPDQRHGRRHRRHHRQRRHQRILHRDRHCVPHHHGGQRRPGPRCLEEPGARSR